MSEPEDNSYDDADEDAYAEGEDAVRPLRGTASRANPLKGGSAPPERNDATVTINAPDGSVREYELTDTVKGFYETMVEQKFHNLDADWFDYWWNGTELIIEYQGKVRDADLRDMGDEDDEDEDEPSPFSQPSGMPRQPHPAWFGRMGVRSVGIFPDSDNDDEEYLDAGMAPVCNRTTIDIQDRADQRPLSVEDLFIRPWEDGEGQMPVNTDHADGEVQHEIQDFRDTSEDETLAKGERGNRYHL